MGDMRFLGRRFNHTNQMWEFEDKSGIALPDELRQEVMEQTYMPNSGARAIGTLFKFIDCPKNS